MSTADLLTEKGLPAHFLAERSVLGAVLLDGMAFNYAAEILAAEDFHAESHRVIFRAMAELSAANRPVDFITLGEVLERLGKLEAIGGHAYLVTLTEGLPRSANVEHYARIVKDRAIRRRLLGAAQTITESCLTGSGESAEILEVAEQLIFQIAEDRVKEGLTGIGEITGPLLARLDAMHGQEMTGLRTGYDQFDKNTAGLQPGELVVLAARPSMGKTAFAMNIAENVALGQKKVVAVFSLEMSKVQLVLRMLCSVARVNNHYLRMGFLGRAEIEKLTLAAARLAQAPVFIDETSGIDVVAIRSKCRRLKKEHGLDLVIVDYLQLMGSSGRFENRNLEIGAMSRALKALAKELNSPVIALSQLSRAPEQRKGDRRPILSDLRESGAIEQDADLVAFVHRDEMYDPGNPELQGKAEIIIGKQRNGPLGTVRLAFLRDFTRFENLAEGEAEEDQ
ncbi:MAG: replicative DNA helicase [Terriglobales bacterium]